MEKRPNGQLYTGQIRVQEKYKIPDLFNNISYTCNNDLLCVNGISLLIKESLIPLTTKRNLSRDIFLEHIKLYFFLSYSFQFILQNCYSYFFQLHLYFSLNLSL